MELDKIRKMLRDLALSHGLTEADLHAYDESTGEFEWHIDWKQNLTSSLANRIAHLEAAINLYETAISAGDKITAKAALIDAGVHLHSLTNFFEGMMHDVKKAYLDPRFNWPEFPSDDWKIPAEYNFKE